MTSLTYIYNNHSLFWLDRDTSITSGGVKLDSMTKTNKHVSFYVISLDNIPNLWNFMSRKGVYAPFYRVMISL